jgi:hypothetical protein
MRLLLRALVLVVVVAFVPRAILGIEAHAWREGDPRVEQRLGDAVAEGVLAQRGPTVYATGEARFDGQSSIAIHQMALLGLGSIIVAHPETRERYLPAMREAARRISDPKTLAYATRVYGHNGLVHIGPGEGHAYLGYVNLGLGMLRVVDPSNETAWLHDRLTKSLAAALDAAPNGLIETYPGETWPPDVTAVAGSIGLHARATGKGDPALLERWAHRFEACAVDASGWLVQRTRTGSCAALDAARGSGTALGAYFLSFGAPALAQKLERALSNRGLREIFGFAAIREYLPGVAGSGDINAGPILFGLSVGASGFGLGAARAARDAATFDALYRSTSLFGIETERGFAAGGLLGNALLLAMLTAGS